jgi:hypothetical protein
MATKKEIPPYFRCDYDIPTIVSIQSLARGDASEQQQKDAINWLINVAAGTYNTSFSPDGDRQTSFAEGRRFVGQQIVKLLHINASALRKANSND